jgi:hypothetical protein
MYAVSCGCDLGDGDCAACHGYGEYAHWKSCTLAEYMAAIEAAGGLDMLKPLSSYTRVDGDEWGPGRRIDTTWGKSVHEPVCCSSLTDHGNSYWIWQPPASESAARKDGGR